MIEITALEQRVEQLLRVDLRAAVRDGKIEMVNFVAIKIAAIMDIIVDAQIKDIPTDLPLEGYM